MFTAMIFSACKKTCALFGFFCYCWSGGGRVCVLVLHDDEQNSEISLLFPLTPYPSHAGWSEARNGAGERGWKQW